MWDGVNIAGLAGTHREELRLEASDGCGPLDLTVTNEAWEALSTVGLSHFDSGDRNDNALLELELLVAQRLRAQPACRSFLISRADVEPVLERYR